MRFRSNPDLLWRRALPVAAGLALAAGRLRAQAAPASIWTPFRDFLGLQEDPRVVDSARPEAFGTQSESILELTAWDFSGIDSTTVAVASAGLQLHPSGGNPGFVAGVHLPSGAMITGIEMSACDNNSGTNADVGAAIQGCPDPGGACSVISFAQTTGAPGCTIVTGAANPHTIANKPNTYVAFVAFGALDGTVTFRNVKVRYKLQLSPAPATATFADVPKNHPFFRAIEAFAGANITGGCGSKNFCPDGIVTRQEVAKFFAVALGLNFPN